MKIIVTGGAGFIGSHVTDKLLMEGNEVTVIDNLSSGKMSFIGHHIGKENFKFIKLDMIELEKLVPAIKDADIIYHLAANPDVRLGSENTKVHLEQNILVTYNLLEAMRMNKIHNLVFTSTSTVYGEASIIPTPENYGPLIPISLYGASKLACEALITSYCHTFDMRSWIFRFANVVGGRSTHGIIMDFIGKLKKNPESLEILGDGQQRKSYIHVSDCVQAIMYAVNNSKEMANIFNIGSTDTINSTQIGELVVREMGLTDVNFTYTGGKRGWKGDVPLMLLSVEKLRHLGWEPGLDSRSSVIAAIRSTMGKQ